MKKHPTLDVYCDDKGNLYYLLVGCVDSGGYQQVTVPARRGAGTRERAHRLVLECKLGRLLKSGEVSRHKNGNRLDNRPGNLRPGTQADNAADAVLHGTTTKGERNAQSKVTASDVVVIRARRAGGESLGSIARDFGITNASVCDIVKRRTWKHIK